MPEFTAIPERVEDGRCFRYTRRSWRDVGVDSFSQPLAQNPDLFMQLTNIAPTVTGVIYRRWGYRLFVPKIDNGSSPNSDESRGF